MIRTLHHITKAYRKVCNHLTTRSQEGKTNIPQQLQVVAGKKEFKPTVRERNLQVNDIQRRNTAKVKYISYNNVVVTSLRAHIDVFPI